MSYKMGFILSLIFVFQIFLLGSDILCIQVLFSQLDSAALSAGYMIANDAGITQTTIDFIAETTGGTISCTKNCSPRFGDTLVFEVVVQYDPLIMQSSPMNIVVTRSTVIGYYN